MSKQLLFPDQRVCKGDWLTDCLTDCKSGNWQPPGFGSLVFKPVQGAPASRRRQLQETCRVDLKTTDRYPIFLNVGLVFPGSIFSQRTARGLKWTCIDHPETATPLAGAELVSGAPCRAKHAYRAPLLRQGRCRSCVIMCAASRALRLPSVLMQLTCSQRELSPVNRACRT